jgi:hypothetical protein
MIYDSEHKLREMVEKRINKKISDNDWRKYKPNWEPPYDEDDVEEVISNMGEESNIAVRKRNEQIGAILARSEIMIDMVEETVEECRISLFGKSESPFPNLDEARKWIFEEESIQSRPEGHAPRFGHYLDLSTITPDELSAIMKEKPGIYGREFASLSVPMENEWIGEVVVSDNSPLRILWLAVYNVVKKIDCQEAQATAYILTGEIPYLAPIYGSFSYNPEGLPRGKVVITIRHPVSDDDDVVKLYKKMRHKLWEKKRDPKVPESRYRELALFMKERFDSENPQWEEHRREWNRQFPEWRFDYWQHFRVTYLRAKLKLFTKMYPWNFNESRKINSYETPDPPGFFCCQ